MGYFDNQGVQATKATWANPQIVPDSQKQNGGWYYNPATGYVDRWWSGSAPSGGGGGGGGGGETGGGGGGNPIEDFLNSFIDPIKQALDEWNKKVAEFDKNNPFSFDEAQARASAEERLNPYYTATLNEYVTGWRRSSQRSVEDMTRTVGELNADASKLSERERFATQEAIRNSEEGYAGSGLFFSGQRERTTGVNEVQGLQKQSDLQTNLERGINTANLSNARTQEDIALQEAQKKRLIEAERITSLETDIAKQKKEAEVQHGLDEIAYAGPSPGGSLANQLTMQNQLFNQY